VNRHGGGIPRGTLATLLALVVASCGRYADFTLPPTGGTGAPPTVVVWEPQPEPVLTRGAAGAWDSVDVLNPSVVRGDGRYFNLYSGYDGSTWRTGLATSDDGYSWAKQGVVLSPDEGTWEGSYIAANGSALLIDGELRYWYQAGSPPRIGLATSADGLSWAKRPDPVLETGPRGSWDEMAVGDPYVIEADGRFYMYYLGEDRARRQRLGVAYSDGGILWTKLRDNPILELGEPGAFDEAGLGEPAVWRSGSSYWMLYVGRDRQEFRRLGLAVSTDGVHWERADDSTVIVGDQPWNARVVCDPSVEVRSDDIRVWFGGGDVAHPAENINGQIGVAWLRLGGANLAE